MAICAGRTVIITGAGGGLGRVEQSGGGEQARGHARMLKRCTQVEAFLSYSVMGEALKSFLRQLFSITSHPAWFF